MCLNQQALDMVVFVSTGSTLVKLNHSALLADRRPIQDVVVAFVSERFPSSRQTIETKLALIEYIKSACVSACG